MTIRAPCRRRCASPATRTCVASRLRASCRGCRERRPPITVVHGHRHLVLHRGRRRRTASTWTSSLGMADGCDLRIHPTGKAQLRLSVQSQGQGHETTFAQIVSHQLGIPPEDVEVIHGDTDNTPLKLGTYGLTLDAGVRCRSRRRRPAGMYKRARDRRRGAGMRRRTSNGSIGRWQVVGDPTHGKSIAEIAMLAHSNLELPDGVEGHLDAQAVQPAQPHLPVRRTSASSMSTPAPASSRSAASSPSTTAGRGSTR